MSETLLFPESPHIIPDEKSLLEAFELPVQSHDGKPITFGELVAAQEITTTVMVIFIRHFFCSLDQNYVRSLSTLLSPPLSTTTLPSPPPPIIGPATLIIIGCGDPSRISPFIAETACEFPVFTDPTLRLYEKLGMKKSLLITSTTRPPYMNDDSLFTLVVRSLKQMIQTGLDAFKGGNYSQNGGEWIFRDGKCEWVHRMESTSDHTPVEDLAKVLRVGDLPFTG